MLMLIILLETMGIMQVVNRFRYQDLWPCNQAELESFGRDGNLKDDNLDSIDDSGTVKCDCIHWKAGGDPLNPSKWAGKLSKFPKPDLSSMVPFSPDLVSTPVASIPGASGPLPEFLAQFILSLPAGAPYQGTQFH